MRDLLACEVKKQQQAAAFNRFMARAHEVHRQVGAYMRRRKTLVGASLICLLGRSLQLEEATRTDPVGVASRPQTSAAETPLLKLSFRCGGSLMELPRRRKWA